MECYPQAAPAASGHEARAALEVHIPREALDDRSLPILTKSNRSDFEIPQQSIGKSAGDLADQLALLSDE